VTLERSLHIELFGHFKFSYRGELITAFESERLNSFVAYVLLHAGIPHTRQYLSFVFWPDSNERQARNNLRKIIHTLNKSFPDIGYFLELNGQSIVWKSDADYNLDIEEFETLMEEANQAGDDAVKIGALKKAVSLYQGDLLPGCYDEWIESIRDRYRQKYLNALESLVNLLLELREYHQAIEYGNILLRYDPIHESACRQLMVLYSLVGDRGRAVRQYHTFTKTLSRELGLAPEETTRETYERLLRKDIEERSIEKVTPVPGTKTHSHFVGRKAEWQALLDSWTFVSQGELQVAVLKGEAGIGKSRLVEEFGMWTIRQGIETAKTRCYEAGGRLAFGPITDWLRSKPLSAAVRSLERIWVTELSRILPELLIEIPSLQAPQELTQSWQRRRFFEAIARTISASAKPLLLVIDDLQWCDSETLDWISYFIHFTDDTRVLIAGSMRTEEVHKNESLQEFLRDIRLTDKLKEIHIGPLERGETRELAEQLLNTAIDDDTTNRLFQETEGHPLFVIEMIRSGSILSPKEPQRDAETTGEMFPSQVNLSPKVMTIINARLTQLSSTSHELVLIAAVIGREFTFDILSAVSDLDEYALVRGLDELWQRGIIREHGAEAYDFSHDKIREVAYAGISQTRRRYLHKRVAEALVKLHSKNTERMSSQIAMHFEHAGMYEKAISYYRISADTALYLYAYDDVIRYLDKAGLLLKELPEGRERNEVDLHISTMLGIAHVNKKGYGAPDSKRVYMRALALCKKLKKPPDPPILRALTLSSLARGEIKQADKFSKHMMKQATEENKSIYLVEAHYVRGVVPFWEGNFELSRKHLAQALALYTPENSPAHIRLFSQDVGIVVLVRLALTNWYLGRTEEAMEQSKQAINRAEKLEHPLSLVYALNYATWVFIECGDLKMVRETNSRMCELCDRWLLEFWKPHSNIIHGWLLTQNNNTEAEGISILQKELDSYPKLGNYLHLPYMRYLAIQAYKKSGLIDEALSLIDTALSSSEETDERYLNAEYYRLKGSVLALADKNNTQQIESCLRRSLEIARSQKANSLKLRTLIDQAQCFQSLGERDEYINVVDNLSGLLDRLTEGSETADLVKARKIVANTIGISPKNA
jgi:DNA-binding SARP family transcriptional activator